MSYTIRYIQSNEDLLEEYHSIEYMYVENDVYVILGFDNMIRSSVDAAGESEWQFTLAFLTPGVGVVWPIRGPELSQITVAALLSFNLSRRDLESIVANVPNGDLLLEIEKLHMQEEELLEKMREVRSRHQEIMKTLGVSK